MINAMKSGTKFMDNSFFGYDPFLLVNAIIFLGSIVCGVYLNFFYAYEDPDVKPTNYFLVFFILVSGYSLFF